MIYVFSIILIVASNVCYNITQKSTPGGVNPLAALLVTYITAGLVTAVALAVSQGGKGLAQSFRGITWTSFLLGLAIVGLELGYLLAYRAGWNISVGSLVANIALALLLIPIGIFFYHETFEPSKIIGIILCLTGLVFINR